MGAANSIVRVYPLGALAVVLSACSMVDGGLPPHPNGSYDAAFPPRDGPASADARVPVVDLDAGGTDTSPPQGPFALAGAPALVGCSDGTREAFLDLSIRGWPTIAGCSGAWSVPGLMQMASRTPWCQRRSGNTSPNPYGLACAAADLCAAGWHICAGPREVQMFSASHCESAIPLGVTAFFAVAGGGSTAGDCIAGIPLANDIRGCGSFGQPEGDGCYPLDRRLEVADCLQTQGVWQCGPPSEHLLEAQKVFKTSPDLGGVLCCRDEG